MKRIVIISSIALVFVIISLMVFFMLFPKKYKLEIEQFANKYELSSSLVASVINIESGYNEDAVSCAGAVGLMQLLPDTAYDCAKRMGMSITYEQLFDKRINIQLGCFYLRYLLELFDGNLINSLCAYNWGYGNVCNWIALGNIDGDGTITNIPVEETRNYLKKYKVCNWIYGKIYKYK